MMREESIFNMQTFLPSPNFTESARILDNKRLGKQRVEAKQILQINLAIHNANKYFICDNCKKLIPAKRNINIVFHEDCCEDPSWYNLESWRNMGNKIPWENHPAVRMWRGYEIALAKYGEYICSEWANRGFQDNTCFEFFHEYLLDNRVECEDYGLNECKIPEEQIEYPEWMKNSQVIYDFCYSHRANLMRKDPVFYGKYNWKFFGDYTKEPYKWNKEYWKW